VSRRGAAPAEPPEETPETPPEEVAADVAPIPQVVAQAIVHVDPTTLRHHPDNPNVGDVDAILEAIRRVGYVDPVIVQESTGYVLAGNHRLDAAVQAGMTSIPAIFVPFDDDEALAYLLANNQVSRRARYDEPLLLAALEKINLTPLGLEGTGFEPIDFTILESTVRDVGGEGGGGGGAGDAPGKPAPEAPPEFADVTRPQTEHSCPRCGYRWSGKSAAAGPAPDEPDPDD
jgi:hypothetical protein